MIYVIADDLTGATDTGVQFSKQGYHTQVVIISATDSWQNQPFGKLPANLDVLVIDTETREADVSTARKRIHGILTGLALNGADVLYKKVDSTLRGPVSAELDECLKVLRRDLCLFTPSFPSNQRITVGGYLMIQGQPLGFTEYYDGALGPEEASYIPALLCQEISLPLDRIDLRDLSQGPAALAERMRQLARGEAKVLVLDAHTDEHLRAILQGSFKFPGSIFYAGSAGLANALSELYAGAKHAQTPARPPQTPILIVAGSMNAVTLRQIAYLTQRRELCELVVDVEQILSAAQPYFDQLCLKACQAFGEHRHVLIHPDPSYLQQIRTQYLLTQYALDFRGLGVRIRDFLGTLTGQILGTARSRQLILTGGEIAIGVCAALHIDQLQIVAELLPGIPLVRGHQHHAPPLNLVTKAGGFGDEDAFCVLVDQLMQPGEQTK